MLRKCVITLVAICLFLGVAAPGLLFAQDTPPAANDDTEKAPDFKALTWELQHADHFDSWEEADGRRVYILLGAARGKAGEYLVRAENIVVWELPAGEGPDGKPQLELYAEGKVLITRGSESIQGDAVYYDMAGDSGVIMDGNLKVFEKESGVFLYIRGDYIRGSNLSDDVKRKLEGEGLSINTTSFTSPYWSLEAEEAEIDFSRSRRERVRSRRTQLKVGGVPLLVFPRFTQTMKRSWLKSLRVGRSREFGAFVQSDWGGNLTDWLDMTLELDYYEKRGFAGGADFDYNQEDYFGFIDTYYLPKDHGEDFDTVPLEETERGRAHWRHRHYLPYDIRMDAEVSYLTDRNFLEEYFEREAREEKEQETYVYFRKLDENRGATLLLKDRINDFQTQVDYLPGASANIYSQRLWETGMYWDSENEFANVRLRYDEDLLGPPQAHDQALRFHSRNTLSRPIHIVDSIYFTPWAGADLTTYDDSPGGGDLVRAAGLAGFRLNGTWWKVFDFDNDLLDLHGVRHILSPELRYTRVFGSNYDPWEVSQFESSINRSILTSSHKPVDVLQLNEIDNLPEGDFFKLSFRNRFETKRKLQRFGDEVGTVTFLDVDLAFSYQNDFDNNQDGVHEFAAFEYDLMFEPRPGIVLTSDAEYNLRDGKVDVANVGVSYQAAERHRVFVGHRYARDDISSSEIVWEYIWSQRWSTEAYFEYEWESKGITNAGVNFQRNFQDFILEIGVDIDKGDDDVSVTFGLITPFEKSSRDDFFSRYAYNQRYKDKNRRYEQP